MKITNLFTVQLPSISVSIEERLKKLDRRIKLGVIASNFICPQSVRITREGERQLSTGELPTRLNAEEIVRMAPQGSTYSLALIEDFLTLVIDERFQLSSADPIICIGAPIQCPTPELGAAVPYIVKLREGAQPIIHLFSEKALFPAGTKILLVNNQ